MLRESKILTALELRNLFGLNTLLHTRDKAKKRNGALLGAVWIVLILMIALYVGGLVWGLVALGMESLVGAYLAFLASVVILAFGIFKTGGVIFGLGNYDVLCSLPLRRSAIVISRFARMYIEELLVTVLILLPGGGVYAFLTRPGCRFYLVWVLAALVIPLLPLSLATLFGTVVTAVSSRMKHKALVETAIAILVVVGVLGWSMSFGTAAPELTPEMLQNMAGVVTELLRSIYPPALWLGGSMVGGGLGGFVLTAAISAAVFAAVAALAAKNFDAVCRRLNTTGAKHDYRMERLSASHMLSALYRRECKRYFASSVYVTNTIMGPVMGTLMAAALCFVGTDSLSERMGVPLNIAPVVPFFVGGTFGMMPPSAVSVSMEGKNWWIVKTLPVTAKDIFDAKILLSLSLMAPFYVVAEVFLMLALKPVGLDILWTVLIPLVICLFACVAGLAANLLLPRFDWDNEVTIVKQSASAALGGFAGVLAAAAGGIAAAVAPGHVSKAVFCLVILGAAAALYDNNNRKDLRIL